jgi:hypothetical protein
MRSNTWFALLVAAGLAAVMTPMILLAAGGGGGFDSVVHGIESRYHTHASRIPFMGLVSGIAGIATHGGVRGLHVAEIEHLDSPVDGAELNALVEERVGKGWQRMIRETSRDGEQQSLIYVKPDGSRMGLLVIDLDGREMDVVQVSVDPAHLDDDMGEFRPHHHKRAHDSDASDTSGDEKQDGGESDQGTN